MQLLPALGIAAYFDSPGQSRVLPEAVQATYSLKGLDHEESSPSGRRALS
jgi:hypothetical protein